MTEETPEPESLAYALAWLMWCLAVMALAVFLVTLLYMINMFAEVIPPYWAYYSVAIGVVLLQVVLLAVVVVSLRRKYMAKPVWEPWPLLALVRLSRVLVGLFD